MASKSSILSVKIVGDTKKLNSALGESQNRIAAFAGKTAKFALGAAAAVGAIGLAIGAVAIKGGIDRAMAIENAEAKLKGLKMSTQDVTATMDSALKSVKGTAFGLGDAATVAANVVAAGVKPGQDLTRTLKLVADAATIAQIPMNEMGSIFNKVAAKGTLTTEVINQLQDRGIPVFALLAKAMGKTVPEIQNMVTKSKISFADFQNAMEQGMGGAALESGKVTQGAFNNMMAALSRFGEMLIKGVFPIVKDVFGGITGFLDDMAAKAKPFLEQFSAGFTATVVPALQSFGAFVQGTVVPAIEQLFGWIGEKLVPAFVYFADTVGGPVMSAFSGVGSGVGSILPAIGDLLPAAIRTLADILATVITLFSGLATFIAENKDWIGALAAAVLGAVAAWKAITLAVTAYQAVVTAVKAVQLAFTTAIAAYRAGLSLATAIQAGFNVVMSLNPIALIVIAVAALAAGIIWLATQTTFFQDAWKALTDFMGDAIRIAGEAVQNAMSWISDAWSNVTGWISDAWSNVWDFIVGYVQTQVEAVKLIFGFVSDAWSNVTGWISDAWSNVWNGVISLLQTQVEATRRMFSWISDAWRNVTGWISKAWSDLWAGVERIIRPVIDGIVGAFNNVTNAVKSVINWVSSLFNGFSVPGWLRDVMSFMGVGGTGFDITADYSSAVGLPAGMGATGFMLSPARSASSAIAPQINVTITVNAEGTYDPVAFGKAAKDGIAQYMRSIGAAPAAGGF